MAADEHPDTLDLLIPPLSPAAQRAGKALMKLNETELLAVLGTELQRRGLNELGALPKPRARVPKRAKPVEREQLLLLLPVHDDMADR